MLLFIHLLLCFSGSVHYDEGESEAESMTSNMDMSNPIFQLYEAVRGARNSQGQLISEPFLQLPSRKDYPDYYHQISQPICLHQIKYDRSSTDLTLYVFSYVCGDKAQTNVLLELESVLVLPPIFNTDLTYFYIYIYINSFYIKVDFLNTFLKVNYKWKAHW